MAETQTLEVPNDVADAAKKKRPATFDHLKKKKPVEETVPILLDGDPAEAVSEARDKLLEAEGNLSEKPSDKKLQKTRDEAKAALDAAMAEQEGEIVNMVFRSCGRRRYEELLDEHPPTDEMKKEAKDEGGEVVWNAKTFPIALIAASCIEPVMTEDQVRELFDEWNNAEAQMLFMAAYRVNTQRRVPDMGNGFGGMRF